MGLKGNLCCGEIIEQLVHAVRVTPIRNIVFMVSQQHNNSQSCHSGPVQISNHLLVHTSHLGALQGSASRHNDPSVLRHSANGLTVFMNMSSSDISRHNKLWGTKKSNASAVPD